MAIAARFSVAPYSSGRLPRGIFCAATTRRPSAKCCRWRCGWRCCWWRRSAVVGICMVLITLEHQPARSRPSKGTGKIAPASHAAAAVWPAGHGAGADPLWS
ncbi:hypothetical protein J4733_20300 [Klebsiella pneumoniae]|uniref:Uncharacterized protein n=1 Tax=Klebsiella pneumoniae TaxID=573 RepID=A0A939NP23_KLEPN|nr:hypothetical protein [Klebsiella pneumoniae]